MRGQVDLILAHLNEAIFALSGNNPDVAGAWFRQFSDRWDQAVNTIRALYPNQYDSLDADRQQAETALAQTTPERPDSGQSTLRELRDRLLDIADDLNRLP